jgi:hypothetical protein
MGVYAELFIILSPTNKARYSTRDEFETLACIGLEPTSELSETCKARLVSVVNKSSREAHLRPIRCSADQGMTPLVPSTTANAKGRREQQQQQSKANCAVSNRLCSYFFSSCHAWSDRQPWENNDSLSQTDEAVGTSFSVSQFGATDKG